MTAGNRFQMNIATPTAMMRITIVESFMGVALPEMAVRCLGASRPDL